MQESKSMRKRLAEWSNTPEGRVAYEKVAEEMRNEIAITNNPEESEKPINSDDAMKELDEKIALVKQRGTWDGVDVDKYMDEVRGREPEKPMNQEGLDEEIERCVIEPYYDLNGVAVKGATAYITVNDVADIARHFAEWGYLRAAEKDLALTIQDLELLHTFLYAVKNNKHGAFTFTKLTDEQYQEVLKRFNKSKEKK